MRSVKNMSILLFLEINKIDYSIVFMMITPSVEAPPYLNFIEK